MEKELNIPTTNSKEADFKKELVALLNKYSMENIANTPDFVLADYLFRCLLNYGDVVAKRDAWHKPPSPLATNSNK